MDTAVSSSLYFISLYVRPSRSDLSGLMSSVVGTLGRAIGMNDGIWAIRHRLRAAYRQWSSSRTEAHGRAYKKLRGEYQAAIRRSKVTAWKTFCSTTVNSDPLLLLKRIPRKDNSRPLSSITHAGSVISDSVTLSALCAGHFFPIEKPSSPANLAISSSVLDSMTMPPNSNSVSDQTPVITRDYSCVCLVEQAFLPRVGWHSSAYLYGTG